MFGKHTWVNMVLGWFYWLCLFVLNMFASHGDGYLQHTLIFLHIMMTKLSTRGLVIRWARRGKDSWLIIDLERRFLFHYRSNDTLQLIVAINTCGVEEFMVTNPTLNGATKILSHKDYCCQPKNFGWSNCFEVNSIYNTVKIAFNYYTVP